MWDWTGNPFIDTGIAVMMARAKELGMKVFTIKDLTPDIVEGVFKSKFTETDEEFSWLTKTNQRLNSYTMVFSANGPLTNVSINPLKNFESLTRKIEDLKKETKKTEEIIEALIKLKNKPAQEKSERLLKEQIYQLKVLTERKRVASKRITGITTDKGVKDYIEIIGMLLDDLKSQRYKSDHICEITGKFFATTVLEHKGKNSTREWFPLAGSLRDAQTFPSASRPLKISAFGLLAVQLLPMATAMIKGKLACFQTNDMLISDIPLFQAMVEQIYFKTIKKTRESDEVTAWGKNNDFSAITYLLVDSIEGLINDGILDDLPENLCLNIWKFSNTGQDPFLDIIEIPSKGLQFIWKSWKGEFRNEISAFLLIEKNFNNELKLLECVADEDFYKHFHAINSGELAHPSASIELHDFYSTQILGYSPDQLSSAKLIANNLTKSIKSKDAASLFESDYGLRKKLKKITLKLVDTGLPLSNYLSLFPVTTDPSKPDFKPHSISSQIIWFYLNHYLKNTSQMR